VGTASSFRNKSAKGRLTEFPCVHFPVIGTIGIPVKCTPLSKIKKLDEIDALVTRYQPLSSQENLQDQILRPVDK
jgi:hypothetical protein